MSGSMRDALGLRQAATMGNYTRHTTTSEAATTRTCTRCGAKLSRYNHDTHHSLCAPCDAMLHPWTPPTQRTRKRDECPSCGGWKQRQSTRCRECFNRGVLLDFTWHKPL